MGMDPEGILFWGIAYTDDDELPDDLYEKSYEYQQEKRDREIPTPPVPGYQGPEWDRWRSDREDWETRQCGLNTRGSGDYCEKSYYAYPKAAHFKAEWDDVIEITSLDVDPEWRPRLEAYCRDLGLPWREPKWFLTSYYG